MMKRQRPAMLPMGWTPWRLVVAALGAVLVAAVAIGVSALSPPGNMLPATAPPATTVNAAQADATLTPTPRVIAIRQSTALPTATPPTAAVATRAVEALPTATATHTQPPRPTVTPTPWLLIADEPAFTPEPTPRPSPTATPMPTPSPAPTPALPAPTVAPANATAARVQLAFAAADWAGGYYRGDGQAYGRPWTAIYGSGSAYPRAVVSFSLDAAPTEPATLTIAGLDDEWAAPNEVALEVNGQVLFSGESPFANWDGLGNGANAAWTNAQFRLPEGSLHAGRNDIAVANLTPGSNFNAPPYVLLAEATLDLSVSGNVVAPPVAQRAVGKETKAKPGKGHKVKGKEKQNGKHGTGHGSKNGHRKGKT